MCDFDDGDRCDVSDYRWRRARKEHECCACGETIRRTDKYHHSVLIFDGSVETFKHCARCWAMIVELWSVTDSVVDFHLNCGQKWEDNFGELPDHVARLAFMTSDEMQRELVK